MAYNPVPKLINGNATFDNDLNVSGISTFDAGIKTPLNTAADGATVTFDMDVSNNHSVTLGGNRALAVSNVDAGQKFTLRLKQDGTGSRIVTWWSGITWFTSAGAAPTLKTDPDTVDYIGFICTSGGYYEGFHLTENSSGGGGGSSSITVRESDGTPNVSNVSTIIVSNGTLTDDGSGQVTISTGGGGGGGSYDDTYVSGVSTFASGLAIQNQTDIATVSGLLYDDAAISGYFESRVDTNAADIITVSGLTGGGGGGSYTAGSGLTLVGSEFNVYGGSGNFEYIELTTNNTVVPKIEFTGSGVTDTPIRMKVLSSHASASTSGTALAFEGTQGQLFGITDNLSSGTIFSVNDITGLPLIAVNASGDVEFAKFGRDIIAHKPILISGGVPSNTTNKLYNDNGTLKFNGSTIGTGGSSLTVQDVDGSPSVSNVTTIRVTNGSLTDDGGGTVTIATSGGGGGGTTYTAGSGLSLVGTEFNVYGGSGNFRYAELTASDEVPTFKYLGSGATDTPINLEVRSSLQSATGSGTALLFQGTQGQLFSITDNLSSGTIFNVSDITGLPMLEITASGDVEIGEFADTITVHQPILLSGGVPTDTTNKLYNDAGTLKFNGSAIGGGLPYSSGDYYLNSINTVSGLIPPNTFNITAGDGTNYTIDGMGLNSASDPTMYIHKGHTYVFNKTFSGHPFAVSATDGGSVYSDADGNAIEIGSSAGSVTFEVPQDAPDKLYYYCTAHPSTMKGVIYTTTDGATSGYFETRVDQNAADIITVSGLTGGGGGGTTYTAGSGLTLVGTEFNTAGTGNFEQIEFGPTNSNRVRIGVATDISVGVAIGDQAGSGSTTCHHANMIGTYAGKNANLAISTVCIGNYAGQDSEDSRNSVFIGQYVGDDSIKLQYTNAIGFEAAGYVASGQFNNYYGAECGRSAIGNYNNGFGFNALRSITGDSNIELVTNGPSTSIIGTNDNKIHIENTIIGDTSSKLLAIGNVTSSDLTPDATLEIKPNATTDTGLIVQGATSQSASLQEWQNSSETKLLAVGPDGGLELPNNVPSTTTNKLYNNGGTLTFNGSAIGGGISNVVEDTTPQLGGSLDSQNNEITDVGRITFNVDEIEIGSNATSLASGVSIGAEAGRYSWVAGHFGSPNEAAYAINIGYQAGYSSSGYIFEQNGAISQMKLENIYIGKQAGKSSVGADNIAIGRNAYENRNLYEEISFFGTIFAASGSVDSIAIGQSALGCDTALPNAAVSNAISIGRFAGYNSSGVSSVFLGRDAGMSKAGQENIGIGIHALSDGNTVQDYLSGFNVAIGSSALQASSGNRNIGIGYFPLRYITGSNNIEIVTHGANTSIVGTNNNKIHIENTIIGDTSSKLLAIGNVTSSDLTPDATLEIKPNAATDTGLIVQGATSQSATLQEWQNSSETKLLAVGPDGGLELPSNVPSTTTNKFYNNGGTLYFNGSAVNTDTDTTYTAGSGLTLVGTEFNIHGGSGFLDQLQFPIGKAVIGAGGSYAASGEYLGINIGGVSGNPIGQYSNMDISIGHGNISSVHALTNASTGSNILLGNAMASGDTMSRFSLNTLVGQQVCHDRRHQIYNVVGIGTQAVRSASGVISSVAIGESAMGYGDDITYSVGVGNQTFYNTSHITNSVAVGHEAGKNTVKALESVYIGNNAKSTYAERSIIIGTYAGVDSSGSYNIMIGNYAVGYNIQGSNNLEIRTNNTAVDSFIGTNSNKLNIQNVIVGDTSSKLLAIGNVTSSDLTPDATLEIKPNAATDIGLIVQGAVTQTANLQEWQDSSESVLAYIKSDGSLVTSSGNFSGNVAISGSLTAATKSFLIDHPSKPGMKLQYASLEGPENGVYVRGTTDEGFITLPDYWRDLVHNGSITVTLTPVGQFQPLFVEQKSNREIRVGGVCGYYDYVVYGERKDVDKLEVEW